MDDEATRDVLRKPSVLSPPLPLHEQSQALPFTLTLQEEKSNPGQFQLVVNINANNGGNDSSGGNTGPSKKLYANLQALPGLGYDVSSLYRTQKSSPPTSPQQERHGWSDLDAIPSDFLKKVVPDWGVSLEKTNSVMSTQSNRLSDIKARIKKSGKGFVVRLLKGANPETNEVAEVRLAHHSSTNPPAYQELDSTPQAELDAVEASCMTPQIHITQDGRFNGPSGTGSIFEIGSSGETGIQRPQPAPPPVPSQAPTPTPTLAPHSAEPRWLERSSRDTEWSHRVGDEWLSDTETLTQDVRPFGDPWEDAEDDQTDAEPFSMASSNIPTRRGSVTSVMPTPTRGLSVVGPVRRVPRSEYAGAGSSNTKVSCQALNRSHAKKSVKRKSPRNLSFASSTDVALKKGEGSSINAQSNTANEQYHPHKPCDEPISKDSNTWHHQVRNTHEDERAGVARHLSLETVLQSRAGKKRLKLETKDVPRSHSGPISPLARRSRGSPSAVPKEDLSPFRESLRESSNKTPPLRPEIDEAQELRSALEKVLQQDEFTNDDVPVDDAVGDVPLPPGFEIRQTYSHSKRPLASFVGLACSAICSKLSEGLALLQAKYGSEPPVPSDHVRVRWTCSCGKQLYDDFVERRRGAARLLEAYLNRPQVHTPSSPSKSSTSSTLSSVFSSSSTASTLATPQSTSNSGSSSSWGQGDSSKYSPTRLRNNNPFSVRIGSYPEPQWLLTCANEGRYTPKIVHLDVNTARIRSDKDLAMALREHYSQVNRRWFRILKLRGLTTIDFVQFEVHRNRFADIRKCPDMPSPKSGYDFEPADLVPPVGSQYLLHLFKHPEDYDGELVTYLRAPKRRSRLEFGVGWGINLVEGFLAARVWMLVIGFFVLGSIVFAAVWVCKRNGDVQGAFAVSGWIITLAALAVGWAQACLE